MRKVLSFVLVLAMVLGCVSMAFAAQMSDVKGTKYENAVNALTELGVISGYTDGTYKPANQVTRAQFVALLVKALGYKPVKTATPFKDVPADNQYSGYIAVAYTLGITGGKTKDTFAPNDPVTYNQAIAFIVRGLGYTKEALTSMQGTYSYPLSEIVTAQQLGMFDHCDTTGNAPATRGDYALFLYDVLDCFTVVKSMTGSTNSWTATGATLLTKLGVSGSAIGVIEGDEPAVDGLNLTPYIGKNVEAYKKTSDGKIIAIKEVKSTTLVGKYTASTSTLKVGSVTYTVNTGATTATKYFTNTATASAFTFDGSAEHTFEVEVSGKKISKIYSASNWNINAAAKLTANDVKTLTADKPTLLGKSFVLDNNDEIDTTKFELVGVNALADIAKDNVVYVYTNNANEIVKVAVGTTVVEGLVSRQDGSKYTINGTQYATVGAVQGKDDSKVVVSNTVKAYLDADGKIYYATLVKGTADTYAVVLNAADGSKDAWASDTTAKDAKVKLYNLADGTVADYYVVADDVLAKKADKTLSAAALKKAGSVIKYSLNSDGKIDDVVVVTLNSVTGVSKNGYVDNHKLAEGVVVVGLNTTYVTLNDLNGSLTKGGIESKGSDYAKDAFTKIAAASVLNKTTSSVKYIYNSTTGYVDYLFIDKAGLTTVDKTYVTVAKTGVKDVNGTKKNFVTFLGSDEEKLVQTLPSTKKALYELTFNADDYAVLTVVDPTTTKSAFTFTTYVSFTLVDNGISEYKADGATTATSSVIGLGADVVYLKWNSTDGQYVQGSKSDLSGKVKDINFYVDADNADLVTFVLYELQ